MQITSIESRVIQHDVGDILAKRLSDAPGLTKRLFTIDTVHTDEGIDGYSMQIEHAGEGRAIGHALHDAYAPLLLGEDPTQSEALWQKLRRFDRRMFNFNGTIASAIDVALWDIRGKIAGQPIGFLLGLARTQVPTYATARSVAPSPEQVFEEARVRKAEGYRGFKVQFWDGLKWDAPRFRAARDAVGSGFPLMQDAAGNYRYNEALAAGRVLEELAYHWFEEPIPDRQIQQLRRLAEELRVPILATETSDIQELPEFLRHGAADMVRGDVLFKSGITGLRKAAAAAELFGFNLEVHGLPSALLDVANLHVALAINNSEFVEAHNPVYYVGLKGDPLAIDKDGCRRLPQGPGLGVEIDWDWLENHTVEIISTPSR